MTLDIKLNAGLEGEEFTFPVEWADENCCKRIAMITIAMQDQNKPRQLEIRIDDNVVAVLNYSHTSNTMQLLQSSIAKWQRETFPGGTSRAKFAHLREEIEELDAAIQSYSANFIRHELADCFILLCGIASVENIDLYAAAVNKMAINANRKWGTPNENGVIHHV